MQSVSVSLSKALGMGSRVLVYATLENVLMDPIAIMNDFAYANVSDMWLGAEAMQHFGTDFGGVTMRIYSKSLCRL